MRVFENEKLEDLINDRLVRIHLKRSRYSRKYFEKLYEDEKNVCGIFGLKKTGKTTMMLQEIESLNMSECAFLECTDTDNYLDVEDYLSSTEKKYIFIDEIAKTKNFVILASTLADCYPDKKIIITADDSASLLMAKENELYDRINIIHTTYISFEEHRYLLQKDIEDYIMHGGILSAQNEINDKESLMEYYKTAIISNVCSALKNSGDQIGYRRLGELNLCNQLEPLICKIIENSLFEFILSVLKNELDKFDCIKLNANRDLCKITKNQTEVLINWSYKEIFELISTKAKQETNAGAKERDIQIITRYLIKLDVLSKNEEKIYFTQPFMQYHFTKILMDSLLHDPKFKMFSSETKDLIKSRFMQDTVQYVFENVLHTDY